MYGAPKAKAKSVARVFQAVRIAVNDELGSLEAGLLALPGLVREGGRVVVLSYHSLEDRRVKRVLRSGALDGEVESDPVYGGAVAPWRALTRGALGASDDEIRRNPRARSVRMRAAVRTALPWRDAPDAAPPAGPPRRYRRPRPAK